LALNVMATPVPANSANSVLVADDVARPLINEVWPVMRGAGRG
jgi:hypothetical protein